MANNVITIGSGGYYLDQLLSNFGISYAQNLKAFVADQVFKIIPVKKRSGQYKIWSLAEDYRVDSVARRRPGTRSTLIDAVATNANFNTNIFAKSVAITDEEIDDAEGLYPVQQIKIGLLQRELKRARELRAAKIATTAATYAGNTGGPIAPWNDYLTSSTPQSHPFTDLQVGIDQIEATSGVMPNRMLITSPGALALRQHPDFIERFKAWTGTVTGNVLLPDDILGMKPVIARGSFNSANRNVSNTATLSKIWGKNVILYYEEDDQVAMEDINTLQTFKTFSYEKERKSKAWYGEAESSNFVESQEVVQEVIVAPLTGFLITSVIN